MWKGCTTANNSKNYLQGYYVYPRDSTPSFSTCTMSVAPFWWCSCSSITAEFSSIYPGRPEGSFAPYTVWRLYQGWIVPTWFDRFKHIWDCSQLHSRGSWDYYEVFSRSGRHRVKRTNALPARIYRETRLNKLTFSYELNTAECALEAIVRDWDSKIRIDK